MLVSKEGFVVQGKERVIHSVALCLHAIGPTPLARTRFKFKHLSAVFDGLHASKPYSSLFEVE